jgi:hypothetical protein
MNEMPDLETVYKAIELKYSTDPSIKKIASQWLEHLQKSVPTFFIIF